PTISAQGFSAASLRHSRPMGPKPNWASLIFIFVSFSRGIGIMNGLKIYNPNRDGDAWRGAREAGESSVRSAMFIATSAAEAPSSVGAALFVGCSRIAEGLKRRYMPLLRSLQRVWGGRFYKHGAPNGACAVSLAQDA